MIAYRPAEGLKWLIYNALVHDPHHGDSSREIFRSATIAYKALYTIQKNISASNNTNVTSQQIFFSSKCLTNRKYHSTLTEFLKLIPPQHLSHCKSAIFFKVQNLSSTYLFRLLHPKAVGTRTAIKQITFDT